MADKIEYILVEAYQKLKILLCVPESLNVDMLSRLEEYEDGIEALKTLQNLWKLEEAAGVIKHKIAQVEASKSDDNEMKQLMTDLDENIRLIPRLADENDNTKSILMNDGKPSNSQSGVFLYALDQYIHNRLNYLSMSEQVEREKRENENASQVRVQQYEAARHTLQLELEQKMKKYKEEIEDSDRKYEMMKGQLSDVKRKYEDGNAALNKFIEDQKRKQEEDHMAFLRKYNEESSKVNKDVNKTNKTLQDQQNQLMKTRARLRMELDELLETYDKEMADWDKRIKELSRQHKKEKKELEVLDDHFRKIDEEKERIAKEEAEIKAKAEYFEAYKLKLEKAATGFQKVFRGYKDRKIVAQLKAKAKKAAKKSKKSKSKK